MHLLIRKEGSETRDFTNLKGLMTQYKYGYGPELTGHFLVIRRKEFLQIELYWEHFQVIILIVVDFPVSVYLTYIYLL